ncbi:hypothetical protein [Tateyamaria sp. SN6-1]|uniref:hypothetical protein n=1 Tax=Tateyamaria sp. SN6-1 TaxID=3092148 RepID=UPI0039F58700
MPHKKEILQAWFDRVWSDGDVDAIPMFLAPGATSDGILPDMALTPGDMPELVHMVRKRLGQFQIRVAKTIEHDTWISALIEFNSHVPETGDPIQVFGQIMARFEERQMVEVYHSFDFLSYFEQLGQLPPNTLAVLLAGSRLQ